MAQPTSGKAQFGPAWTSPSIVAGTVVTLGTFKANDVELARPTNPTDPTKGGNIHHYRNYETYLFGDTSAIETNNLQWIKLSNTLLVCDRCILDCISWQNIYKNWAGGYSSTKDAITTQTSIIGASSGTTAIIDGHTYRVRLLTGGRTSGDYDIEWNAFNSLCSGDNNIMHWKKIYTWCSETSTGGPSGLRFIRGFSSGANGATEDASMQSSYCGFRPVLELIE